MQEILELREGHTLPAMMVRVNSEETRTALRKGIDIKNNEDSISFVVEFKFKFFEKLLKPLWDDVQNIVIDALCITRKQAIIRESQSYDFFPYLILVVEREGSTNKLRWIITLEYYMSKGKELDVLQQRMENISNSLHTVLNNGVIKVVKTEATSLLQVKDGEVNPMVRVFRLFSPNEEVTHSIVYADKFKGIYSNVEAMLDSVISKGERIIEFPEEFNVTDDNKLFMDISFVIDKDDLTFNFGFAFIEELDEEKSGHKEFVEAIRELEPVLTREVKTYIDGLVED